MTLTATPLTPDTIRAIIRAEISVAASTPWMTRKQALAYLKIGNSTMDRAIKQGRLRACNINGGQKQRFHRDELDRYMLGAAE
jgi:excisionase family DNA binding protein